MDPKMASLGSSALAPDRSPWHSPIPYLFGGLAAMLGLIAFALLILACSYWKLSRHQPNTDVDLEAAEDRDEANDINPNNPVVLEDKFLVIMAGQNKPTFLATPASSRNSSFGSKSLRSTCCSESSTSTLSLDEDNLGSFRHIEMVNRDHQQQHEASVSDQLH